MWTGEWNKTSNIKSVPHFLILAFNNRETEKDTARRTERGRLTDMISKRQEYGKTQTGKKVIERHYKRKTL